MNASALSVDIAPTAPASVVDKTLKVVHLIALTLFFGSIPSHILLYVLAERATDLQSFATLMHAKYVCVTALTLPALLVTLVSGAPLMVRQQLTPNKARWMAAKLVLVALITLNGVFVLLPVARDLSLSAQTAARAENRPPELAQLERREALYGDANIAMILATIAISVFRPGSRRSEMKPGDRRP